MWLILGDVLRWLAANSTRRLDVIAQYWQLVASPDDPRSGDYGYSASDMRRFGAPEGAAVYKAIDEAADRNVSIRYAWYFGLLENQIVVLLKVICSYFNLRLL